MKEGRRGTDRPDDKWTDRKAEQEDTNWTDGIGMARGHQREKGAGRKVPLQER